jgi:hypothetical protein
MAGYDSTKLSLVTQDFEGTAAKVWKYATAADADATIVGAGYFADGVAKGMAVGDLVDVIATTGPKYKRYQVASLGATAATVAAPTAIT